MRDLLVRGLEPSSLRKALGARSVRNRMPEVFFYWEVFGTNNQRQQT